MDENVTNTQKHDEHVSAHVYILYAKTKKFKKKRKQFTTNMSICSSKPWYDLIWTLQVNVAIFIHIFLPCPLPLDLHLNSPRFQRAKEPSVHPPRIWGEHHQLPLPPSASKTHQISLGRESENTWVGLNIPEVEPTAALQLHCKCFMFRRIINIFGPFIWNIFIVSWE